HQRFLMQMSVGTVPHDTLLRSIELFGTKVAPAVRQELGVRPPRSAGPLPRPLDR
ncbi:MAG: LLM class flavin-dependent oxidoreductase, partial [Chloroflexota bacterium]|nr:LLM class flavin-dependent oxidoreductase [Chloroflexota bacterium]